jgi:hypothetical protein
MGACVGNEPAVSSLAGADLDGCPGVRIEADGAFWSLCVRDLMRLPRA